MRCGSTSPVSPPLPMLATNCFRRGSGAPHRRPIRATCEDDQNLFPPGSEVVHGQASMRPLASARLRHQQQVLLSTLLLMLLSVVAACSPSERPDPVIGCLGDSITMGVTESGVPKAKTDPLGGYPGRLGRLLGPHTRVLGRGIGGATTRVWLENPRTEPGLAVWRVIVAPWLGPEFKEPDPLDASLAVATLRPLHADIIIIFLGINDIYFDARRDPDVPEHVVARLETLHQQTAPLAHTVLVATALPNHRDPAPLIATLNERIRAHFPNFLPLGERFSAAQWEHLLGDEVHPN